LVHKGNGAFGRYITLKPVITVAENNGTKKSKIPKTRVIRISEPLYRRFVGFSQRYYNVETYETILENLINSYEETHRNTYWYHNTS